MEELLENRDDLMDQGNEKEFIRGPISMNGSGQFIVMYRYGECLEFRLRVYQMPDSHQFTLIQDTQKHVDLATFLDDGKIFLKIGNRYMLFNEYGSFIDEIEFEQANTERRQIMMKEGRMASVTKNPLPSQLSKTSPRAPRPGSIGQGLSALSANQVTGVG